ncbi:MAG: ABC-F family ATP-binding cassette domain-containing protein, partial [Ilumatobacter sp.]|nr:ABC-F family ATP-binding cassette domain-containing protein [Ilumatobacter sp.]
MPATLTLQDVSVSRAARRVLDHVDLVVPPGARLGVVGPNGVGKTTLLAVAACAVTPERGTVRLAPPTATVGWLHQEPERTGELVRDLLDRRTGVAAAQAELDAATEALAGTAAHADAAEAADAADRYDVALQRWLALGAADLHSRIGQVADELGMSARLLDQPVASLSGGEAARVGLAALMLSRFDVYLLDEPTNDLDLDGL